MNKGNFKDRLRVVPKRVVRFKVPLFLGAVVLVYGFIIWRATDLANAQPDPNTVAAQSSALKPTIDPATISKIQELQDNSVSVRALFNQARQNPFKE